MARIEEFHSIPSDARSVHGPVTCGHRTFIADGQRILQLDTYGSSERKIANKVSQSIQVDAEHARQLLDIIYDAFPEIAQ